MMNGHLIAKNDKKKKHLRNRTCEYCERPTFNTTTELKAHLLLEHYEEGLRCVLCTEIFNKLAPFDTIRKHYQRRHKTDPMYRACLDAHKSDVAIVRKKEENV